MNREVHVRICEGRGVRFPPATRRLVSATRRTTVLYAHHDRDGRRATKGARQQTRDEGLITHFRAAASHPHGLSVATA